MLLENEIVCRSNEELIAELYRYSRRLRQCFTSEDEISHSDVERADGRFPIYARALLFAPALLFVSDYHRFVLGRVELEFEVLRRALRIDFRSDFRRFAGRELRVHDCR